MSKENELCQLCEQKLNIPTKLDCGDNFCFMCIKTYISDYGQTCPICKKAVDKNLYEYVMLEASGGINPENLNQYDIAGLDVVSLGFITHSVKSLDFSLEIK